MKYEQEIISPYGLCSRRTVVICYHSITILVVLEVWSSTPVDPQSLSGHPGSQNYLHNDTNCLPFQHADIYINAGKVMVSKTAGPYHNSKQ